MLHRVPGALAVLLLACSLQAVPQLTSIYPSSGFPYGGTHVTLTGTDFVDQLVHCTDHCQNPGVCPVTVLFGDAQGEVQYALPDRIIVIAPPHAEGNVNVTVKVTGRPTITRQSFFSYDDHAEGASGDYARYLVPVIATGTPGANGSNWVSETTILNASAHTAQLIGPFRCVIGSPTICAQSGFAAGEYGLINLEPNAGGAFVYVPRPLDHEVAFGSRVRDTSRTNENWGAEIPLVRATDFAYRLDLLDIPTIDRYRATLRVYSDRPTRAIVRVWPSFGPTDEPAQELVGELTGDVGQAGLYPLYLQLDPLTVSARLAAHGNPVRIEVIADSDGLADPPPSIWAFVSITNNETQQVTIVTPHK